MNSVKEFYNQLQFPGTYTMTGLDYHHPKIRNPYLKTIDNHLQNGISVLDAGCGTGLISNLFAKKYPSSRFVGIDFADSVNYAKQFALDHDILNVEFRQDDLLLMPISQYDVVLCQGVLHHIPDHTHVADNLSVSIRPGGKLILAVYHPWGKLLKKFVKINYGNDILHQDQEQHPYETSFTPDQISKLFPNFYIVDSYPKNRININAVINSRNGGLTTYVMEKNNV
jgi:2-polyprenyl-3-methyl-5-hydroxy-6-metoxy-1,4-benzoquinol methylase